MPSLSPTLLRPLLFTAALGLPLLAHAAEQNPGVQAGISAGATSGAYAHYDVKPLVVPAIAWQGERFFASPGSLGMYLYKGQGLRLSAAVTPYTLRFKTNDVNDAQLRRLHSRQMSAMAGINGEYSADCGMVEASVMREVTGHGGGFQSRLHYSYPIQAGRFTWVPRAGVVHSSARLLDYYYGISDEEALRSGLAAYRPGSTTSPSCRMSDHVPVSRPNPFLERLFGGNMLEGTFKAVIWVAILCALLAWTTLR